MNYVSPMRPADSGVEAPAAPKKFSELFKVGIGPSSSHTVGPMKAAAIFSAFIVRNFSEVGRVTATVFGSLAWTGRGHATDRALMLGLSGITPELAALELTNKCIDDIVARRCISLNGTQPVPFSVEDDVIFDFERTFVRHPNTMAFAAYDRSGALFHKETWFSIGGGFIEKDGREAVDDVQASPVPYPYSNGKELLAVCAKHQMRIDQIVEANETVSKTPAALYHEIGSVWTVMQESLSLGLVTRGTLPGGLSVQRRAPDIYQQLTTKNLSQPTDAMSFASVFAMAVNEENAGGGRIVTAPTNGAAGVIPAVLFYLREFHPGVTAELVHRYFLTATAIGGIIKDNASISGAEVGCQGEVGSAASMAAAGLTAVLGGTPQQIENAAEIALEHHLGMTCDPVGGLVQIPCIERNAFGAVKAINAATLALLGSGDHRVTFDQVVETMRQTGADMSEKYRETSRGGLAINVPEC